METQHNAEEMKTQVQTYIIEETLELIYNNEKLEQWENLVKELGLKGQQEIQQPEKSPIPFLALNSTALEIISTLCPTEVEIEKYNLTPIPVEILDLVALSRKEGYFQKIEVWYDEKDKDPAVIGICGHWYESTWYSDYNKELKDQQFATKQEGIESGGIHINFHAEKKYLLGRWADVKEDFKQLAERAKEIFISHERNEQEKIIKEAQRKIEDIENDAFNKFGV